MFQIFNKSKRATVDQNSPELHDPVTEWILRMMKKRLQDGSLGANASTSNGGSGTTATGTGNPGGSIGGGGIDP